MSGLRKAPQDYPNTANAGIFDANAFRFEGRNIVHTPVSFPDANKVVALCGTYGWVVEHDSRIVHWSSGYVGDEIACKACAARGGHSQSAVRA